MLFFSANLALAVLPPSLSFDYLYLYKDGQKIIDNSITIQVYQLFAGLRERTELADVPESFRGVSITLATAGLLSLAFMGFAGLVK